MRHRAAVIFATGKKSILVIDDETVLLPQAMDELIKAIRQAEQRE